MAHIESNPNPSPQESRYEKFKESSYNKQARTYFSKTISSTYADQNLSEDEEAILFSQAFHRLWLKDPTAAEFGEFDEYEIQNTNGFYTVKGFCIGTNSYGARTRGAYTYELCKRDGQWTCITDVGAKYLKWILIGLAIIFLPSILAYCSMLSY